MLKHAFGRTGLLVSVLGYGAAPVAYLSADQDRAAKAINELLDAGANLIDTAASYPGSEKFLGERIMHRRSEFLLVSKCGQKIPEFNSPPWSAPTIAATVDRALTLLRTDYIDVMLLHSCALDRLENGEAIGALVEAREAGKIRFAGYSGDNHAAVFAASHPEIAVIETSISIADQVNIDHVLPLARKHQIGVLAKRPIANAAWKNPADQPGMYQNYSKTYSERLATIGINPADLGFTGPHAWPELALRFTLSQPGVHTAIIGTRSPENTATNIEYANKGRLPEDLVQKIRGAYHKADPDGKWTGQT